MRKRLLCNSYLRERWCSFNLDEYWPCASDNPTSFRAFMEDEVFQPLGLHPEQVFFLDGSCPEEQIARHCAAYETLIQKHGGIHTAVLGIGVNGHLAFNEPGTPWDSRTRRVSLSGDTRDRPTFPGGAAGPTMALTVGLGTILEARRIVLLAMGESKAEALRQMLLEEPSLDCPASCLRTHPDVLIFADEDACSQLPA